MLFDLGFCLSRVKMVPITCCLDGSYHMLFQLIISYVFPKFCFPEFIQEPVKLLYLALFADLRLYDNVVILQALGWSKLLNFA